MSTEHPCPLNTQAGYVALENADTKFERQDLCAPLGTKGGNQ